MKDGMLMEDWARELPWASKRTQAKSLDSRSTVEKEARLRAAAASSTMEIRRLHKTSRVMASKEFFISGLQFHDEIAVAVYIKRSTGTNDSGRFPLLYDGWTMVAFAAGKAVSIIHRYLSALPILSKINKPLAL